ncbi:MAG: thiol reductase thioredoxin [Actinobacteria bacterium QS_5_72_10]|nr:MAG: thiol reductase thioredoxin [Actinobacteria bacterium QS_5_72_10]
MATVELTSDNFASVVEDHDIVLLDFWADWCQPCHQFTPIFEEASQRHPDVLFGKVDAEANPELASEFNVQSIPTLAAIRGKVVVFSEAGVIPAEGLDELVGKIRELDMDEVHAEIARQDQDGENGGDGDVG